MTRCFGRSADAERLTELLDESRLVTLVGAPGVGKTRLALELGGHRGFVALESVSGSAAVPTAFASSLGFAQETGSTTDMITARLADTEALLIVDNCEHLVDAVAEFAHRLLLACPRTRILATSRVGLGVSGEQLFRVPSLDGDSAALLFADRARLVRPDFVADAAVAQICGRLEGLPLAIELAAAWTRVLTPVQILHRLDTLLPMLTQADTLAGGNRHSTMEATVAWSYRLLSPEQKRLFGQLSVFVGGFDLPAVAAVAGDDVLDELTALVDHSLVVAQPAGEGMRYRLLEPIREYAAAVLGTDEQRARARHAEHYRAVARRGDLGMRRADRGRHLAAMSEEEGNLHSALRWARENDPARGLLMATSLAYFWELRGRVNDGRAWLAEFLDAGTVGECARVEALTRLGRLAWRQWDHEEARRCFTECLDVARRLGDHQGTARGMRNLALAECPAGDLRRAADLCQQSIRLHSAQGDEIGCGWAWTVLGLVRAAEGRWQDCDRACRRALEMSREQRSTALEATAHLGIAFGAANLGDTSTHRRHLAAVLAGWSEGGPFMDDPDWLWAASGLAANEGRNRAALRLAGAARAVGRRGSRMPSTMMTFSDEAVERVTRQVGSRTAARLLSQGATMTLEQLAAAALEQPDASDRPLSVREREVAGLVGDGLSNEQIAAELVLSRRTVETHVEHLKQKLDLSGRNELMAWELSRRMETDEVG